MSHDGWTITSASISPTGIVNCLNKIRKPQLPYPLPLYRRCQFHLHKISEIKTGEIWISVASQENHPRTTHNEEEEEEVFQIIEQNNTLPWIATHIDLTNAGQTQVWLYASWEAEFNGYEDPASSVLSSPMLQIYRQLLDGLFRHLRSFHIPHLSFTPSEQWKRLKEMGKIVSTPYSRSKVLFGTLSETLWPFIDDSDLVRGISSKNSSTNDTSSGHVNGNAATTAISRQDRPYLKYILKLSSTPTNLKIPQGFRIQSPMSPDHLQTVVDRTSIPRTIETLRQLPSIALYDDQTGLPAAWGLLGKDGSLSSLHTEADYRGRGFAEVICQALFMEQGKLFRTPGVVEEDDGDEFAHADVSHANVASRRVLEKLGAKVMWRDGWIEVELGE